MSKLSKPRKRTETPSTAAAQIYFHRKRRHIEDVPFYKLQHDYDELPLDPARSFILEKIRKFTEHFLSLQRTVKGVNENLFVQHLQSI